MPALSVLLLFATLTIHQQTYGQTFRIVTVNALSGAATGAALGAATIALQDKAEIDYYPVRFGVGLGTIMGLGTGFYDLSQMAGPGSYYVDGFIHTANASGTIIIMDTFYGAATGTIVGTAIALMTESRIIRGMQFGSAAGAWVGFTFGLIDAFLLSSSGSYDNFYESFSANHNSSASGLLRIEGHLPSYSLGFLNPMIIQQVDISKSTGLSSTYRLGVELTRINISF